MSKAAMSWQVKARRIHALVGMWGYVGLGLCTSAVMVGMMAWHLSRSSDALNRQAASMMAASTTGSVSSALAGPESPDWQTGRDALPGQGDQGQVLSQMEALALQNHVAWTKVEYSMHAPSDAALPTMEIRGLIKAPYPELRQFLTSTLAQQPGAALRSLVLQRDVPETREVEARVTLIVYMSPGDAPASHADATTRLSGGSP